MNNYSNEKNLNNCENETCCQSEANKCIGCTVSQCEYHCGSSNYCTLGKIEIVTHEKNPTMCQCTDCASFKLKV